MKPEAYKTALANCCLVLPGQVFLSLYRFLFVSPKAISNRGLHGFNGWKRHLLFPCWIRGIRVIRGSILLLVFACCLAPSAKAQTPLTSPGVDGLDCITAYEADDAPLQICEDSSDPWNDLDEISLPSDDRAVIPSRDDQATPQFTTTTLDASALYQPGFVPAFLFSTHSSFCLHEHLRERAPPSLV